MLGAIALLLFNQLKMLSKSSRPLPRGYGVAGRPKSSPHDGMCR